MIGRTIYGPDLVAEDAFVTLAFGVAGNQFASLIIVCVLAASMSTLSSTINTIASNFTLDLYARFVEPTASTVKQLWVYRINVLIVAGLAALISVSYTHLTLPTICSV